jgi:hypothetical protein
VFGTEIYSSRPRLWPISQIVASITLSIGQHAQEPRACSPDDPAILIEAPQGISALLVNSQDLRHELPFGEVNVVRFYVLDGDIDPKPQSFVHSDLHGFAAFSVKLTA